MQILISYFYQIRFFKPNMIPLSTAVWDPQWFHQGKGHNYQFKDKNGVWNGIRANDFMPGAECEGLCSGPKSCSTSNPLDCPFLNTYRKQLNKLDFQNIMSRFEKLGKAVQEKEQFEEEPIIVLIVYETPTNPCSERGPIIDWFKANGYDLKEFER